MYKVMIKNIVYKLNKLLTILSIVSVTITAIFTIGNWNLNGGGASAASQNVIKNGDVFILSNKAGYAFSTKNYRDKKSVYLSVVKKDVNDPNQYFTLKNELGSQGEQKQTIYIQGTHNRLGVDSIKIGENFKQAAASEYINKNGIDDIAIEAGNSNTVILKIKQGSDFNILGIPDKVSNSTFWNKYTAKSDIKKPKVENNITYYSELSPVKVNVKSHVIQNNDPVQLIKKQNKFRIKSKNGYYITARYKNQNTKDELYFYGDKSEKNKEMQYFKIEESKTNKKHYNISSTVFDGTLTVTETVGGRLNQIKKNTVDSDFQKDFIYNGVYLNTIQLYVGNNFIIPTEESDEINKPLPIVKGIFNDEGGSWGEEQHDLEIVEDVINQGINDKNSCTINNPNASKCLILTDQVFNISQYNTNFAITAKEHLIRPSATLIVEDKSENNIEQTFKFKSSGLNTGYFYLNGTVSVLTSLSNVIKVQPFENTQNQEFRISEGFIPGTIQIKDHKGNAINITNGKIVQIAQPISQTEKSQLFNISPIGQNPTKKCVKTGTENVCILNDNQEFTISNSDKLALNYPEKANLREPSAVDSYSLPSLNLKHLNNSNPEQKFKWKTKGSNTGYIFYGNNKVGKFSAKKYCKIQKF
jgi:hypothetical protein